MKAQAPYQLEKITKQITANLDLITLTNKTSGVLILVKALQKLTQNQIV